MSENAYFSNNDTNNLKTDMNINEKTNQYHPNNDLN